MRAPHGETDRPVVNAHIMFRAPRDELEADVRRVLEVGLDGGLVIGAHSIGPDITVERYEFVHRLILRHGTSR